MTTAAPARYHKYDDHEAFRPLCFLFPEQTRGEPTQLHTLTWTDPAREVLWRLNQALRPGYLPTRSLNTLLELHVPGLQRVARRLGTDERERGVFAWADGEDQGSLFKGAMKAVARWTNGTLTAACQGREDTEQLMVILEDFKGLYRARRLLSVKPEKGPVYDWTVAPNGTTEPRTGLSYPALADAVARQLEGREIFPGLGPVRRIVPNHAQATAELISAPIRENVREPFSLVLSVRVLTLPTFPRPLVALDVHKRRWVSELKANPRNGSVTGYVFGTDESTAHPFTISAEKGIYTVNGEFKELANAYDLDLTVDGAATLHQRSDRAEVLVNLRAGYGKHKIEAGVPERDKIDALDQARVHLETLGFQLWADVTEVETKNSAPTETAFVDIDDEKAQADRVETWLTRTRQMLPQYHRAGSVLFIAYHPSCEADARLAQDTVQRVLGDLVHVATVGLPEHVHGLRDDLPGARLGAKARARQRAEAWTPLTDLIRDTNERDGVIGVLVLAPRTYPSSTSPDGKQRGEDKINKRVARNVIARRGRAPVQYLLPPDPKQDDPARDFRMRLHNAWMHLVWGHHGNIDEISENAQRLFPLEEDAQRLFPRERQPEVLLGFTAIQRNRKKGQNDRSFVALAFRVWLHSAKVEAAFAYEDHSNTLQITPWHSLRETLLNVATKSPLNLNTDTKSGVRQHQYQTFVFNAIQAEVTAGRRPLVMVDSTHAVRLWPWLADVRIDSGNLQFDAINKRNMQIRWQEAGLRLVRIRQDNAPQVVTDKYVRYDDIDTGEVHRVHAPTWLAAKLLRVEGCRVPTYFSFGSKLTFRGKRGVSCYRSTPAFKENRKKGEKAEKHAGRSVHVRADKDRPPFTQHRSTPNPVEISVLLAQPQDDVNQVAEFVESLRSGYGHHSDWTNLPLPLFFERVVREYIADFDDPELDEDADDNGDD